MRYLVILQAANPAGPPPEGLFEAIAKLGGEAAMTGALLDTAGLAPSALGARVQVAGGSPEVTGR